MTEKQYNLLLRLLRSDFISVQDDINFVDIRSLNKYEAYELINTLILTIKKRREEEHINGSYLDDHGFLVPTLPTSSVYNVSR